MDINRDRSLRRLKQNARANNRQSISLSIRTASHTSPPALQQATPPSQPYPIYPLPIPKDKETKALELYIQYCDAQLKEKVENSQIDTQSTASHRGGFHLTVPGPPTAQSVASYTSSKYSLATSAYGANTDLSSVVSFDDEDEPSSAAVKNEGALTSFDGTKIKQRRRKRLSPAARAKAALVRHLASCWVCRSRRVKCPLEHHDIDLLERLRQQRFNSQRLKAENNSGSSISSSSQQTATSVHVWPETGPNFSQSDTLMGIGGGIGGDLNATLGNLDTSHLDIQSPSGTAYSDINEISLGTPSANQYTRQLDIQSPAGAAYSDINDLSLDTPVPNTTTLSLITPSVPDFTTNPYIDYQDGQMLGIGVQRNGYFCCQHLDGICLEYFTSAVDLLAHFELAHFEFTRIDPAHRFVCLACTHLNYDLVGPCSNCLVVGSIELWIYGHYIRNAEWKRNRPDAAQSVREQEWTPTTLFSETYTTENMEWGERAWGGDEAGEGGFGPGYTDAETGDYGFQGGAGLGGMGFEYQPSHGSSYGTNRHQGVIGFGARQMACGEGERAGGFSVRICFGKVQAGRQHARSLVFLLGLLAILTLSISNTSLFTFAHLVLSRLAVQIRNTIQLLGFLGILANFGMSLPLKRLAAQKSSLRSVNSSQLPRCGLQKGCDGSSRQTLVYDYDHDITLFTI